MDLYGTLGVKRDASLAELRRRFRRLARRLHPDLNPGDPTSASRYASVLKAFEILADPAARAAYDRGELAPSVLSVETGLCFEGFDFGADIRAEVAGFREIFEDRAGDRPDAEASTGEDLVVTVAIGFDEARTGTERRIHVVRQDRCPICDGLGDVASDPATCRRCGGTGNLRARRGHMIFRRRCGECDGSGQVRRRACVRCQGEGRAARAEWLDVSIPAGVDEGGEVRIPAGGNAGRRGGRAGDLVLRVDVEEHRLFGRCGADLNLKVPVTIAEAALGGHIEIPTPEGAMSIEIPAGTQTGQRFRVRGRGMPRLGEKGRGDLYVEARVVVPRVEDDRVRRLLEEVARLMSHEAPRAALLAAADAARQRPEPTGDAARRDASEEERDAPRTKAAG